MVAWVLLLAALGMCQGRRIVQEDEEERALGPVSPRFLQRRATTVFYDDFSSGHLDRNKWTPDASAGGVGGDRFQMYTPLEENLYIKNGHLFIRPTLTVDHFGDDYLAHGVFDAHHEWGYCAPSWEGCHKEGWNQIHPVMSGLVRSKGHIRYGKVEVRARLPKGDWLWPAIWMMPLHSDYGGWPQSGEMDIMEACGNEHLYFSNGESAGIDLDHVTMHYGNNRNDGHKRHGSTYRLHGSTFGDGFHKYWLDWNENHIRMGVDDHTVLVVNTPNNGFFAEGGLHGQNIWSHGGKNAPFDKPFYLILNVAVGGPFFWDGYHNQPYDRPWSHSSPTKMMDFWNKRHLWYPTWHGEQAAMEVDYVKMEQY